MTTLLQPRRQLVLKTAGVAPFSVAEARHQCSLVDDDTQDEYLARLIKVASEHVAAVTSRILTESTWRFLLECFPDCDSIEIPGENLRSVTHVKYWVAGDVAWTTLSPTEYDVDTDSCPGQVVLGDGKSWPSASLRKYAGVEIEFIAGWDAPGANSVKGEVPDAIRHAIALLVTHWFENRSAVTVGNSAASVSRRLELAVDALLINQKLNFL